MTTHSPTVRLITAVAMIWMAAVTCHSSTLPLWLNSDASLLPPVDEQTRLEVKQLIAEMRRNAPEPGASTTSLPLGYTRPATRLVQLGELVGQSLVWDYLVEPEVVDKQKLGSSNLDDFNAAQSVVLSQNGDVKREVLMRLHNDPGLSQWLLPLLRLRMAWLERAIDESRTLQVVSTSEIGGLEGYLNAHGTESDIDTLNRIVARLREAHFGESTLKVWLSPDKQRNEIKEARRLLALHSNPYFMGIARVLKAHGVEVAVPSVSSPQETLAPRIAQLPPSKKAPEAKPASTPSEEPTSSTPWSVIVILIVAATGLLWLLLKGRK
ncbi:MAG: hypothetical protein RIS79_1231 [Verrucomicrobiota bacterium]|jgi:hypothetical protein